MLFRTRVFRLLGIAVFFVVGGWVLWWQIPRLRHMLAHSGKFTGRYNIIWITLCSVRADHLSVYGYTRQTTPVREKNNLFRQRPDIATQLERMLITHIVASGLRRRLHFGMDAPAPQLWMDRVIRNMDLRGHPEMLEQLRALGYIQ